MSNRTIALGAGAVVVAVVAVVSQLSAPTGAVPTPEVVPVEVTELICPDARTVGETVTEVSAVTPTTISPGDAGRVLVGRPKAPNAFGTLTGPNRATVLKAPAAPTAVVGVAVDDRAPGFAMDQWTTSSSRARHGLSGTTCVEPAGDMWFVGTASDVGQSSSLYLTDTEATPATVDVELFGKDGRIDAPGGLGLVVPGNSRRVVDLDQLAPGAGDLAVHVTASSGRVGAAVFDSTVRGLEPRGSDWVPAAAPPAARVVVPGLGNGEGARRLSVLAPGEGTATVRVRLIGQQGSFAPAGAASLEIDRGKVTTVELGAAAANDDTAAVVESDVALVAGVRWTNTAGSVDDLAFSGGSAALTAPAVVTGLRNAGGFNSTVMLTATDRPATLLVQPLVYGRPKGAPTRVVVPANRTVRAAFSKVTAGPFAAVITPQAGSGPVHAAVLRTVGVNGASGITVSTLRNARITVTVPDAVPNLDVGLGR